MDEHVKDLVRVHVSHRTQLNLCLLLRTSLYGPALKRANSGTLGALKALLVGASAQ